MIVRQCQCTLLACCCLCCLLLQGLAAVPSMTGDSNSSVVVMTYDRLSNGWAGPSAKGAWGDTDMVFSMRVHISRYDD